MENRLKIKYITNARIPTEKAHGYQICKMCEQFVATGVAVELTVPVRQGQIKKDAFEYYSIDKNFKVSYIKTWDPFKFGWLSGKIAFYLQSLAFLIKLFLISIEKDEIVYTRDSQIVWLFKMKGAKVIFEAHNWPNSKTWLYKLFIKNADLVICNTRGTEQTHLSDMNIKTAVYPNGVDMKEFDIDINKEKARNELYLPTDKIIVMYVGHLYGWKGAHIILETAKKTINKELSFVLVGGTEKEVYEFDKNIKELGLENVMLAGHKEKNLIPKYLKCADILLLPNVPTTEESIKYTSPIKMFEYMASKRPIIASELPSIKEILNDKNSVLVKPDNAEEIADGIGRILQDEDNAKRMAEQAYRDVSKYTWENRARGIIKEIDKL